MKKFVYMAAAAAVALTSTTAVASTPIEVGRQTLLDNGSAPATLRLNLTGAVTANGTHSLTCTLSWTGAAPTGTALDDFSALNVATSNSSSSSAPVSGTVNLAYSGRINPKGMAVGDAIYTGSFSHGQSGNSNVSGLSCPTGATLTLGFRAAVPGSPGQDYVAPVAGKEAEYGRKQDTVCHAARKAVVDAIRAAGGNEGYAYGEHCPDLIDYSNVISPAVVPVAGQDYIAPVQGAPEVAAQTVTYGYTPSYSFTQSGATVVVDGYTLTIN
jgi:hypothetical protein